MISQNFKSLIFNKRFVDFARSYVHSVLDKAEISHYIHSITDSSVLVYVGLISYQNIAKELLLSHPLAKYAQVGVEEDGDPWIELFF